MSDVHVLHTDYHGGEDHIVKDKITAHKDHKRHIAPMIPAWTLQT